MSDSNDSRSYLDEGIKVAVHHKTVLDGISNQVELQKRCLTNATNSSEELLKSLGYTLPEHDLAKDYLAKDRLLLSRKWDEILAEATQNTPEHVDFDMLLTQEEISGVLERYESIGDELNWFASLDRFDVAIAVSSGVIAGVIDVLLVGVPSHPGFMGTTKSEGGWLSNLMKEKVNGLFPPDKIKALEKMYGVSYDPSTSRDLLEQVSGLSPSTHRFQSLGHDPFLGFVFGVKDILNGEFSAISKDGRLIVQQVADPFLQGEELFVRILEAIKTQFGHLASDIATSRGLPAPLMPLLEFLQFGKIGDRLYPIGEVARMMYRSGYDARHFMASSIPVMIIEIIVRLGYFVRQIRSGKSLAEAIPKASSLKLRRQLLIANTVATLINAGKVYVTQNPLAISWAQALAFMRYVVPELTFLIYGKEAARSKLVEEEILQDYRSISHDVDCFINGTSDFVIIV